MISPGDVVTVEFPGATGLKRRPAVVVSTELYQRTRSDVIIGLLTSQVEVATLPSYCVLRDWEQAGLHRPSAFRAFLATLPARSVTIVGRLSEYDWRAVQQCLGLALSVS